MKYFFLPFVFYPIWGLFACFFVAMWVSGKIINRFGLIGASIVSTLVILVIFFPFFVVAEGGNIPVIYPAVAVIIGLIFEPYLDSPIGKADMINPYIIIPASVVISVIATMIIRRRITKSS